jgi:hypothetical protein
MKLELSRQIFKKYSIINESHENLCSGSQVVPCGRTHRQTLVFRKFMNVPNNEFFPTIFVERRKHVDAVGCRTFYDGLIDMFVFDILLIPSGGIQICSGVIAPTCTPLATSLNYGCIMVQIVSYRLLHADARIPFQSR